MPCRSTLANGVTVCFRPVGLCCASGRHCPEGSKSQKVYMWNVATETSAFFLDRLGLPSAEDDGDYVGTEALMTGAL